MAIFLCDRRPPAAGRRIVPGAGTVAVAVVVAGLVLMGGCATAPRPVSKIVGGRLIVTRPISPEAYEHFTRALLYEEEERWDEAAREVQQGLPFDDEGAEVRAHLATLFIRLGRVDDAAEQVQRSLEIAQTVEGRLAAAHVAEARHDDKAALAQYRGAATLALTEQDSGAQSAEALEQTHLALADAQLAALDVGAAAETIRALRDASPDDVRARVELGALAWALGRLPEAEAALAEALRLEPSEVDARLMMAALLVATGRTPAAKLAFREALERSEDSIEIAELYLKWLVARGDKAEAADEAARLSPDVVDDTTFEAVLRLDRAAGRIDRITTDADAALKKGASSSRVALLVAGALLDAKDRAGAAARLATVPRESPDFIESRLRIAEALRDASGTGQQEQAGRALDAAAAAIATASARSALPAPAPVPAAPAAKAAAAAAAATAENTSAASRDWTTDLAVARALWEEKRGDAIRAGRTLDAALEKDADNPRLRLVRAAIDERRGEWRRALSFADKILATDARHVEALNFHGFVSVDHDDNLPMATRRLQVAMALDPGAGGIVDSLGWAYLHAGDLSRAAEFLTEADRLEPGDPEIQSHLADLLARKQDVPGAIAMYQRALKSAPPERLTNEINARLRALQAKSAAGR
jgi:Tfp pilus assembly protein PilF